VIVPPLPTTACQTPGAGFAHGCCFQGHPSKQTDLVSSSALLLARKRWSLVKESEQLFWLLGGLLTDADRAKSLASKG
jgi:hypothetical protein